MIIGKYNVQLMSNATGEVVLTIGEMIRTIWFDRIHLHFWNLSWKLIIVDKDLAF